MPHDPFHLHHHASELMSAHDLADAIDEIPPEDYWEPVPPTPSSLNEHAVPQQSALFEGKRIALLVCGGIAAMKVPLFARELRKQGAEVTAFVSEEALRYVTADALAWSTNRPVVTGLTARAEHLGDGETFDAYMLVPATYNTLNKFAAGIADNLVTTVLASALGRLSRQQTSILVVPTMHGSMHNPILEASLHRLQGWGVRVIPPRDAYGKHNLPDFDTLVYGLARELGGRPLSGLSVLVTGGPTPVPLDAVRYLTNRFTGRLSYAIAQAFYVAGAEVHWVLGKSSFSPPTWLPCYAVDTFQAYLDTVQYLAETHQCEVGVFSAAVADYTVSQPYVGKLPSGQEMTLHLQSTPKVIDLLHQRFPEMYKVTFKLESGRAHEELIDIARQRLQQHSQLVVVNQVPPEGESSQEPTEQEAWLVTEKSVRPFVGKSAIAQGIVEHVKAARAPFIFEG